MTSLVTDTTCKPGWDRRRSYDVQDSAVTAQAPPNFRTQHTHLLSSSYLDLEQKRGQVTGTAKAVQVRGVDRREGRVGMQEATPHLASPLNGPGRGVVSFP